MSKTKIEIKRQTAPWNFDWNSGFLMFQWRYYFCLHYVNHSLSLLNTTLPTSVPRHLGIWVEMTWEALDTSQSHTVDYSWLQGCAEFLWEMMLWGGIKPCDSWKWRFWIWLQDKNTIPVNAVASNQSIKYTVQTIGCSIHLLVMAWHTVPMVSVRSNYCFHSEHVDKYEL